MLDALTRQAEEYLGQGEVVAAAWALARRRILGAQRIMLVPDRGIRIEDALPHVAQ